MLARRNADKLACRRNGWGVCSLPSAYERRRNRRHRRVRTVRRRIPSVQQHSPGRRDMERRRTVRTPNRLVSARAVPARWRHPPRRRRSWRARRAGEKAVYGVSCAVVRRTHHQDQPVSGGGVSLPLPPYDWPRLRRPRASARRAKRMQNLHARPLDESPPRVVLGYRRPGTSDAAAPQNARTHRPCQRNTSPCPTIRRLPAKKHDRVP